MKEELLTEATVEELISPLPGWRVAGAEVVKEFRFSNYLEGIDFVRRVGECAEALNHHPDLFVGWRKVTVRLSTHSAGGLTRRDVEMAGRIEAIVTEPVPEAGS